MRSSAATCGPASARPWPGSTCPRCAAASTPAPGENFDPEEFLALRGTLYLLAEANHPASRLLQCLVADITRTAKDLADHSLRSRLDPPLTLVLDEIANWAPLPALPTCVSAYGGSGIVTIAVIQSRAQMARSWGSDAAKAIWDSATITGILGGVTDAENLRDFVAIAGDRDATSCHASTGKGDGLLSFGAGRSYSEQTRTRAVLTTGEIRGLPEGTMLMFYKGLDPMLVTMTAYYCRRDRKTLLAGRENGRGRDRPSRLCCGAGGRRAGRGDLRCVRPDPGPRGSPADGLATAGTSTT